MIDWGSFWLGVAAAFLFSSAFAFLLCFSSWRGRQ